MTDSVVWGQNTGRGDRSGSVVGRWDSGGMSGSDVMLLASFTLGAWAVILVGCGRRRLGWSAWVAAMVVIAIGFAR